MEVEAKVTIDVSEVLKFAQGIAGADRFILYDLFEGGRAAMDTFKQSVQRVSNHPVNFGQLRGSYVYDLQSTGTGMIRGTLYSPLIYAEAMEYGRRPGKQPPIGPIALWVIRKGIAPKEEALGVAYVIARAIGAGTSKHQVEGGFKMFEQGYEAAKEPVKNYMDSVVNTLVEKLKNL